MTNDANTCVNFIKQNFKVFLPNPACNEQIGKLATLLVYKNILDKSPYPDLKVDILWCKVINLFINDCCNILKLPCESGFSLTILSGMLALPQILKAEKIFKNKGDIIIKELPYEIHLPNQLKFHSIFVCPVLKEISTVENPPMLLNCGHAVSK